MNILLDVHTHSIMSGHAFSTVTEMAMEAQRKGLKILGITEHTPALPGAPDSIYFRNIHVIPRQWGDTRLLMGCELNILDNDGTIDLDEFFLRKMDIRLAGLHKLVYTPGTKDDNTAGLIKVIRNPWIDIITHPGDGTAELHFEPIVLAAKEAGTLLEINNSSMKPVREKVEARDNNLEILRLCKKYEVPVILGSDAHIHFDIANYQYLYPLLSEAEFPEALIMNDKPDAFLRFIDDRHAVCEKA